MIKIQKEIDGKMLDFWQYTEEELAKMKAESAKRKAKKDSDND